ncbi:MAG: DNA polymerase II large subunit [Candidatus Thorarchaeota archaeon]|nr:DNA polymerase II large subunit [Candidatus Thorarchaeota archaeon]
MTESEDIPELPSDISLPCHSPSYEVYFRALSTEVERLYRVAELARAKGYDPSTKVEIPRAHDVAARVEATLDGPTGVATRIRELQKTKPRDEVAFIVAKEIAEGSLGGIDDSEKAADKAVRVALAILTESITAAPLEGIAKVRIRGSGDEQYLALYLAGPIRAAGGTEAAVTVLVADYVRQVLGLPPLKSTESEVERALEEVELYARLAHLQYPVNPELIRVAARNIPIMLTGEPTEEYEVSGTRDLERIETNRVRGGAVLVLNDGVVGRAAKLSKIVHRLGMTGWDWLDEIAAKLSKSKPDSSADKSLSPKWEYLADVIGGRPVFSHPSRAGGFRLRYGRSRNTGLSAVGIHPATMFILGEFLAAGTHIRTERPGKGSVVAPVDTIEGPTVLLNDGTVKQIFDPVEAKKIVGKVKRVLFLGDVLVALGEFLENNHPLVPSGYCEEWWSHDLERICTRMDPSSLASALSQAGVSSAELEAMIQRPLTHIPSPEQATCLSLNLKVPLHPRYLYRWSLLSLDAVKALRNWLLYNHELDVGQSGEHMVLPNDEEHKRLLESIGVPHKLVDGRKRIQLLDSPVTILAQLGDKRKREGSGKSPLEWLNSIADVELKDKAGFSIGARMGRPEKAEERKMKPPVHALFPLGREMSTSRSIERAARSVQRTTCLEDFAGDSPVPVSESIVGGPKVELVSRACPKCSSETFETLCPVCGSLTIIQPWCSQEGCGRPVDPSTGMCPISHDVNMVRWTREVSLAWHTLIERVKEKISEPHTYDVRGVLGLTSDLKIPEYLGKGILRAKHDVYCYRDGTARFDATDAPLTHFTPREIGVSIKRLHELGYQTDFRGVPLTSPDQIVELKVQDIVVPERCADYLVRVGNFTDDCLVKIYGMEPYYRFASVEDIIGQLVVGLAPHTSAGIVGRIVGFTNASVCYAHPYWHAAKRRNCLSGDEEVLLLHEDGHLVLRTMNSLEDEDLTKFRVVSIDDRGELFCQAIKELVKLKAPQKLYRICTGTGRSITVTGEHKMVRRVGNTIEYVETDRLSVGDRLLALAAVPDSKQVDSINILSYYLSQGTAPLICVHGVRDMLRCAITSAGGYSNLTQRGITRTAPDVLRDCIDRDSVPLEMFNALLYELGLDSVSIDGHISYQGTAERLPFDLPLNTELGELAGLYLSNGHSIVDQTAGKKHIYRVSWTTSRKEIADRVVSHCTRIFGQKPFTSARGRDLVVTLSGRVYYDLFRSILGLQTSSEDLRADNCISFCTAFQEGLLGGFILGHSLTDSSARVNSTSKHLLNHLGMISLRLGLYPRFECTTHPTDRAEFKTSYHLRFSSAELRTLSDAVFHGAPGILDTGFCSFESTGEKSPAFGRFHEEVVEQIEEMSTHSDDCVYDFILEGQNKTFVGGLGLLATYDCDGDEDALLLVMDALLNFSRSYLPAGRGGFMDAPLVLSVILNPLEVDDESHNMEVCGRYPADFYNLVQAARAPKSAEKFVDIVATRLKTEAQYEGFDFTHGTSAIDAGPKNTRYKSLGSMAEKLEAQLAIARLVAAVDAKDVAERVLSHHIIRDIRGNLRAFSTQKIQCLKCRRVYRRIPLSGKCKCGAGLSLTVRQRNISKYLDVGERMASEYELSDYLKQRLILMKSSLDSMFASDQTSLTDFFDG